MIFVNKDTRDGTAEIVNILVLHSDCAHCIQRIGWHGQSSAHIERFMPSSAHYLAVIIGELKHNRKLLSAVLDKLRSSEFGSVVAQGASKITTLIEMTEDPKDERLPALARTALRFLVGQLRMLQAQILGLRRN